MAMSRLATGRWAWQRGCSMAELVMVCALLVILAGIAMPVAKFTYQRNLEADLRSDLRSMRNAIDEFKRFSDAGLLPIELGSDGYPPDLETLVEGVDLVGQVDKKAKFLRRIPVDPFTKEAEWGLRSYQDSAEDSSWGGQNVFDVYSLSQRRGLNGIPYAEW